MPNIADSLTHLKKETATKASDGFKLPKQWRHLSIIALAAITATIGFERQAIPNNAFASSGADPISTPAITQTQPQTTVELPSIKSVTLPPIPVKNIDAKAPYFAASNVVLLDNDSKMPLYEKADTNHIAIASTTKVATITVALAHYKLTDTIKITPDEANIIGSTVGYRVGETVTVEQLMYGLMMVSGNDSAITLSHIMAQPGDTDKTARFVAEMNKLAQSLDMNDTYYKHPAGLDDSAYSSAADMAKLFSYALQNPEFRKIIGTASYEYRSPEGYLHTFTNSNRLITPEMYYQGMIGGKTGFTPETPDGGAGHCLIVAATRNGHTLIAAVYRTDSEAADASALVARSLLDYGFNNFTWQNVSR